MTEPRYHYHLGDHVMVRLQLYGQPETWVEGRVCGVNLQGQAILVSAGHHVYDDLDDRVKEVKPKEPKL